MKRNPNSEAQILHDVRLALVGSDIVLWRNSGAVATIEGRTMRVGLCRGASDLIGILRLQSGHGIMLAIEVKNAKGRLSSEQQLFLDLVRSRGGFACVVRSVPEALAALDRARRGEHQ